MPGLKVVSPMTPGEYEKVYEEFMKDDEPYYVSEHRKSYDNTKELQNVMHNKSDIVLFPISITRFSAEEARKSLEAMGHKVSIIHQLWIKPFFISDEWNRCLKNSKFGGLVLDDDYEQGVATNIGHKLMLSSSKPVDVLCIENRTAGFHPDVDNLPPTPEKIVSKVLEMINV